MVTSAQQIKNVRRLIAVAEEFRDSDGKLDMGCWASSLDERVPSLTAVKTGACNTTVCLAGLAGLDPYFRKQGLRTDFALCNVMGQEYVAELFSHCDDAPALAELFGLNWLQYIEVFQGPNEVTANGRVSKKRTLDRIIKALKRIAAANFGEVV